MIRVHETAALLANAWTVEQERIVVMLQFLGYSQREIAQITGRSLGQVAGKLHRLSKPRSADAHMRSRCVQYEDVMSMVRSA